MGNYHARFLGGWARVTAPGYPPHTTIRREYLDRQFFWNSVDLTRKLEAVRDYYNEFRVHRSLDGTTPEIV